MKKEFKVQAISEKVDILEVNGQQPSDRCLHNCIRYYWKSNTNSKTRGCWQKKLADAYKVVGY